MFSWTYSRLMATQVWPLLKKAALNTPSAVAVMSTSSRTMAASFPPSSSRSRLKSRAQASITFLPTSVEPVNTTFRTSGCEVSTSPTFGTCVSGATTTFNTPGGNKHRKSSPILRVVRGVCGAGFKTTVLPQASAAAVGFQPSTIGAFQGAMTVTTPKGQCLTTTRFSSSPSMSLSTVLSSDWPALSKQAAATCTSIRVSLIGRPLSLVCSVANASACSRNAAAQEAKAFFRTS
mmetsp:Transcript_26609/g.61142  ORF Transcript_26609/g.61142 Transcript_26609/m.61142 type:complete len:234 (-) Transcript_26609:550-1251(-)